MATEHIISYLTICFFLSWQTFICVWSDVSKWFLLKCFSRNLYIVSEIHSRVSSCKGVQFLMLTKKNISSTKNEKNETLYDVVFLSITYFPIGFTVNIFFSPSLFNQNGLLFCFLRDLTFSMEVWSSSLIREILLWIYSLISCISLTFLLKTFDYFITFFIWWFLGMLMNYWKTEIGAIRCFVII